MPLGKKPEYLENKISYEVMTIEEANKMNYVTSWERIAKKEGKKEGIKKGIKEGIKEGRKEGIEEGVLKTAIELIKRGINLDIIAEATGFPKERIEQLAAKGV